MLSNLIIDGVMKGFQNKNTTLLTRKEEELPYNLTKHACYG